ncbi:bifunctional 3-(3-hydroxy-phenyl)propionate/3-hydroxycinnamic acid hydroxylase [Herbaspirillum huttiense]|uniref:bifunctional 3-(3-hydroxy-phenyl)propionate/3-hydroxycinnamic acid hydroxylase n=1 Tax=Herbaspirillum huttiense TaxID=863372 RepID=UPI0010670677|nr:bifunctional 3-(3-hydroxy-phenyl)propionate/3-hydroxycinnamic acid hydroxylase [Herbaspirillum huttiense]QBP77683.1 bifunctional 3-(3-hydroxy-phenyl)propionate/3-hydroxycinnamic acid hydroxylase [Herbaspirillum huttiense]
MKNQDDVIYEVVQVGYGPVSEIMALMLARQGHKVAILERWTERYPLPRAVCIDHEIYRVLCAIGLRDELPSVSHAAPPYRWFNAEWKELLSIDWSAESISGGTEVNFVHQPTMEAMFDTAVRRCPEIDINLGWEAVHIKQTPAYAEVTAKNVNSGETRTIRGRYLIGADGANSKVREAIGSVQEDRGFEADWLVIDLLPNEGVTLDVPEAAQYCNPSRPTTIVPAGVRDGRFYRRWEFMRMPGEPREELETEAMAWKLLEPWVKPDQAVIVRHKVYTFRSLIAQTWRNKRLLIAGDAAHVMPPFMGQGMCAGLRDDWNLAWKLHLVLTGQADDSLLDTYQVERKPHASDIVDLSMYLGKVICVPDLELAAQRDQSFFDKTVAPPPAFPSLTDGMLDRHASGAVRPHAGLLSPHGTVLFNGMKGRFDDLVKPGFILVVRNAAHIATILQSQATADLDRFKSMGGTVVYLADHDDKSANAVVDLDGKFSSFMGKFDLASMLIRPDFYLYGSTFEAGEIGDLLVRFADHLGCYGLRPAISD